MFQDVRYGLTLWDGRWWQAGLVIASLVIVIGANGGAISLVSAYSVGTNSATTVFFPVQSNDAKDLVAGKLLVASRGLADPNFAKTVILLIRYDDEGVVGLIVNRRTDVALSRVFEGVEAAKDRTDPAFLGGPVDVPSVFALVKLPAKIEGAERIFSSVYLISTKTAFEQTLAARTEPQSFHVYLGYAGWTKDQLRNEVESGAWFIFPGETGAVFNSDPASLWPEMIRKTELKVAGDERRSGRNPGPERSVDSGSNAVIEDELRYPSLLISR